MCAYAIRQNRQKDILPYTLPQLHTGKTWYVDFFCLDPVDNVMKRKKYHLDRLKTVAEKKSRASELIATLTLRLRSGWNVWVKTETSREHTPFAECVELYQAYCMRSAEKGMMKKKSAYGYLTYLGMFTDWIEKNGGSADYSGG